MFRGAIHHIRHVHARGSIFGWFLLLLVLLFIALPIGFLHVFTIYKVQNAGARGLWEASGAVVAPLYLFATFGFLFFKTDNTLLKRPLPSIAVKYASQAIWLETAVLTCSLAILIYLYNSFLRFPLPVILLSLSMQALSFVAGSLGWRKCTAFGFTLFAITFLSQKSMLGAFVLSLFVLAVAVSMVPGRLSISLLPSQRHPSTSIVSKISTLPSGRFLNERI